jgi:hypothetical protein
MLRFIFNVPSPCFQEPILENFSPVEKQVSAQIIELSLMARRPLKTEAVPPPFLSLVQFCSKFLVWFSA